MAGVGRNLEEVSSGNQRDHSGEALTEWRSSGQVENEVPSTSPPFWDMDDDNDGGQRTSQLYGKYTWTVDDFYNINKRELRSDAFEVGGYKWYILIYPKGCDVCNHLSLFLCVADHEKILPGWSHFAQFTIAVVNKDPKRTKYSDTLHRFCKKEHDWGWKKFMELSKVMDGFIDANSLIIRVQIQVIRFFGLDLPEAPIITGTSLTLKHSPQLFSLSITPCKPESRVLLNSTGYHSQGLGSFRIRPGYQDHLSNRCKSLGLSDCYT